MTALSVIGYWRDSRDRDSAWPSVDTFVDPSWNVEEREFIADYLDGGRVVRTCMGFSLCRLCGLPNGSNDLSDGTFVWPEGLSHYLREHQVRLPDQFVRHAMAIMDSLDTAQYDDAWWLAQGETPSEFDVR